MIKKILLPIALIFGASTLVSCASIVNGTNQKVSVQTGSVKGAACSLENNKGKWHVNTPGTVNVNRSFNDLDVQCNKKGYRTVSKKVASKTKGMVFGNVIFGGAIGAGVDIADGAAYDYPSDINIPFNIA